MKYIFAFISSFFICLPVFSQEMMEKQYYENSPPLGGDVVIKSSSFKVENDLILKTFEIESLESGAYYMDAWLVAPETKEGFPEYQVAVNGVLTEFTLKPQTHDWQSLPITDAKKFVAAVNLKKGMNTVSIIGKGPEVPNVEFIKLSSNPSRAGISDSKYREFVESIRNNTLNEVYNIGKEQISSTRGTNGEIYDYYLNIPVAYTTYMFFGFTAGQTVNIRAENVDPTGLSPIIDLFYYTNDKTPYSWQSPASAGSGNLNVTIPASGGYVVCLRIFASSYQGHISSTFANLTVNDNLYSNCIVTSAFDALATRYYSDSQPANYFTCKVTNNGFPQMLLKNEYGLIKVYNIKGPSSFGPPTYEQYAWDNRVTVDSIKINYADIYSYVSYNPVFECDLYMGLQFADKSPYWSEYHNILFPKLAADNSFLSGTTAPYNNCIAWSAGITDPMAIIWLDNLQEYDDFYDIHGYTREGADSINGVIAIWAKNDSSVEHASIRKHPQNKYPHGFEWESKIGFDRDRIMHTRDALNGNEYGKIQHYYKPKDGFRSNLKSSSGILQSSFSELELDRISLLKTSISSTVITDFDTKYLAWKKTWDRPEIAIHSNPYKYTESTEYENLLVYCIRYGKAIWPLLLDKLTQRDIFVINLLKDLTYNGSPNFISEMISSYTINTNEPYPTLYTLLVDYCKGLIAKEEANIQKAIQDISVTKDESYKVNISVTGQEILLNITTIKDDKVYIAVYNVLGRMEYNASYNIIKGNQTLIINASNFKKGVYVVQVTIGGKIVSQTINI